MHEKHTIDIVYTKVYTHSASHKMSKGKNMDRAQREHSSALLFTEHKPLATVTGIVLMVIFLVFTFVLALQRTIPKSVPQVDEEKLRTTVASVYETPVSATDAIILQEVSKRRNIATNREYYEYEYEFRQSEICYTGRLTVCYEYDGRGWCLASIAVTDLDKEGSE